MYLPDEPNMELMPKNPYENFINEEEDDCEITYAKSLTAVDMVIAAAASALPFLSGIFFLCAGAVALGVGCMAIVALFLGYAMFKPERDRKFQKKLYKALGCSNNFEYRSFLSGCTYYGGGVYLSGKHLIQIDRFNEKFYKYDIDRIEEVSVKYHEGNNDEDIKTDPYYSYHLKLGKLKSADFAIDKKDEKNADLLAKIMQDQIDNSKGRKYIEYDDEV
ncbi:MAG: hypothetical protein IJ779_05645 [Ruminococcus sp.]|nr:hypothetical protein [Ruminococcus sp.]